MIVSEIEAAAAVAWPPLESAAFGTWTLSAGDGFSRRRNSAMPTGPLPPDIDRRLSDVASWYAVRGLPTLMRITPLCDPGLDDLLGDRGFSFEAPTLVLTRSLESADMVESAAGIVESPIAGDGWVETELDALGIDEPMVAPWLATITSVPSPARFVTPMDGVRPVGAGLGVVVGGHLGVFEVVVRPEYRRRGHAKQIMTALEAFGVMEGASRAFLQVLEGDDHVIDLYRSLGYELSHRYWYRRADERVAVGDVSGC